MDLFTLSFFLPRKEAPKPPEEPIRFREVPEMGAKPERVWKPCFRWWRHTLHTWRGKHEGASGRFWCDGRLHRTDVTLAR